MTAKLSLIIGTVIGLMIVTLMIIGVCMDGSKSSSACEGESWQKVDFPIAVPRPITGTLTFQAYVVDGKITHTQGHQIVPQAKQPVKASLPASVPAPKVVPKEKK